MRRGSWSGHARTTFTCVRPPPPRSPADGCAPATPSGYSLYATCAGGALTDTTPATIEDGVLYDGGLAIADPGSWTNSPTDCTYRWQACDDFGRGCVDHRVAR